MPSGDALPEHGELEFRVETPPVSLQAARAQRDVLTEAVRAQTRARAFVVTGDASFDIEWFIQEGARYETDRAADVDNILKPIIDAFCGPEGVLIDDCQVQAISAQWVDSVDAQSDKEVFHVRIRALDSEAWMPKKHLRFVHLGRGLCFPLRGDLPPRAAEIVVESVALALKGRDDLVADGVDRASARIVLPIQRLFHRTRIHGFPVVELGEVLRVELPGK